MKDFDLRGKDFFNKAEAIHYMGCSKSQFEKKIIETDIEPRVVFGKLMYRRCDLFRMMDSKWQ